MLDPSYNSAMQRMGFGDAPNCAKCGLAMTPENAKRRPELFLHDDCLPDELKEACDFVEPARERRIGPQTQEEARLFHEGVLVGLTIYAREKGDSTLKSENELLRRLMDEQGWKTIEAFERLAELEQPAPAPPER